MLFVHCASTALVVCQKGEVIIAMFL